MATMIMIRESNRLAKVKSYLNVTTEAFERNTLYFKTHIKMSLSFDAGIPASNGLEIKGIPFKCLISNSSESLVSQ